MISSPRFVRASLLAAGFFIAAAPVLADTVSFAGDLADLTSSTDALSAMGVNVTVSAFSVSDGTQDAPFVVGAALPIIQNADGIGVSSGLFDLPDNLGLQVDGLGNGEVLQFLFPMNVRLTKVLFGRVETGDQFDLAIAVDSDQAGDARDVDLVASLPGGDDNIDAAGSLLGGSSGLYEVILPSTVTFSSGSPATGPTVGRLFQFYSQNADDDFTISRIEFEEETDDPTDPNDQVVPEPAGAVLALIGVAGLVTRTRRRASRC